jgi:hypothetical protein
MWESAVNDNAEDFPKVAVDAYPTVVIGVTFLFTSVDWGDQSLVSCIGGDARAEDKFKDFKNSQLELVVCIFDHFIEDPINTTGLLGLEGWHFVL